MMSRAEDQSRFESLWCRCLSEGVVNNGAEMHQLLLDAYCEPQRIYHALSHIEHCLALLDTVTEKLDSPDSVQLAIWFHDVIYQPGAADNEQLSADFFMEKTSGLFDDNLRHAVYELIMDTVHGNAPIGNNDAKYLIDIDLSSFGLPWDEFLRDSKNVRKELNHIPDEEFYPRQVIFQKHLLDRPQFYLSDHFYEKYEKQARSNLENYFEFINPKLRVNLSSSN